MGCGLRPTDKPIRPPWLCGQYLGVDAVGLGLRLLHTLQGHLPSPLHFLTLVILHLPRSLHLLEMEIESCQVLLAQSSSDLCMSLTPYL